MKSRHACPACKCNARTKCRGVTVVSTYSDKPRKCDNFAKDGTDRCWMHPIKEKS